jgi:hypothetical protein
VPPTPSVLCLGEILKKLKNKMNFSFEKKESYVKNVMKRVYLIFVKLNSCMKEIKLNVSVYIKVLFANKHLLLKNA